MKDIRNDILPEELKDVDIFNMDYKDIDYDPILNFKNLRGSIRMVKGLIYTPKDVQQKIDKVIAISIP